MSSFQKQSMSRSACKPVISRFQPKAGCLHKQQRKGFKVWAASEQTQQLDAQSTLRVCAPLINGCWQLAGGHGREVYDNILEKLDAHADAGLAAFDTADIYGPSEQILGQFLGARAAAGKSPVQIFTKYVPNIYNSRPTPSAVEAAIRRSMNNLQHLPGSGTKQKQEALWQRAMQVSSLDLVQLHWWEYGIPGMVDVALALTELKAKGLIKEVGTTNMNVAALEQITSAGAPVACNQVQFSLLDRRPLNGMLEFCEANGIKLFTYGSVGGGLLSDKYYQAPKPGLFGQLKYNPVDLNTSSLKMYWNIVKMAGGQDWWRELLGVLKTVSDKHGVSIASVALKWVMQQGNGKMVYPIVGLRGTQHIEDNLRAVQLVLDQDDMARIDEVLNKARKPKGDCYSFERGEN